MNDKPPVLAGTTAERIAVAMISPFLAMLCYESRFLDRVFLAMFSEMFVAFLLLLVVGFIWALFQPTWFTRVLGFVRHHAWHAMLFYLAGFVGILMIIYVVA